MQGAKILVQNTANPQLDELFENYYEHWYKGVVDPGWGKELLKKGYFDLEQGEIWLSYVTDICPLNGKRILDVGAGFGKLVIAARQKGFDAYGIEPDKVMFAGAQMRMKALDYPPDTIKNSWGESIPFADGEFDVAIFSTVLEHVHNIKPVLLETLRVLKRGG